VRTATFCCAAVTAVITLACAIPAQAQLVTTPSESNTSVICVEAESGMILYERNADIKRPPASMLKLMMLLLVSEGVDAGHWSLDQSIPVSAHAAATWGTRVALREGETWPLGRLMDACAVASANDAATAVAEGLWGSEENYLRAMNVRARELGMDNTIFRSVHGLPPSDGVSFDQTTARDMMKLALECLKSERIRHWVNMRQIQFRPTDPVRNSTNLLLRRMPECDGLKTGFIRAAGFCIAATAERNGLRLVTIVMGSPDKYGRFNLAQQTLERGFDSVQRVQVVRGGVSSIDPIPVVNCEIAETGLVATNDIWVTVRTEDKPKLEYTAVFPEPLEPPLNAATVVGEVRVRLNGDVLGASPLAVPVDLQPKGWRLRLSNGVARWEHLDINPQAF